tara:strand:+ start:526 stop:1023 length:498 start_codon:yes stop_codon:yes gene_type:complete
MKILIFGLPGSGKSTLAKPLADLVGGVHLNADAIRQKYEGHDKSNWDFSLQGRMLQAQRMKFLSDGVVMAGKIAVADFVCPTAEAREQFGADFTVFMDTIEQGRYEDTNALFERPQTNWAGVDYHVAKWFDDTHAQLVPVIERFMKKRNTTAVGYSHWRMEQADV